MPRFSIIMPTFRREHVIHDTIASILQQTFTDWELIVVDNFGSHYKFTDSRIKCHTFTERRGASHARNFGITCTTGELIVFFDDDDKMYPQYLTRFHDVFRNPNVMLAHCGMLTGRNKEINFSYATPEVVVRSVLITPTWVANNTHDQHYFQQIERRNKLGFGQIVKIHEVLLEAGTHPLGGLRDAGGQY